ncbi:MAG: DUF5667 domain-containing protein, partial [Candidatus Uhrbacteria bacterium]|nr:DUF5667 domain-containing protein [Candidatus Uhrbacteria bacterium]
SIRFSPAWRMAAVACSVVLLFGVGTSSYAYASENVLPDHPLYPLRESVEAAEERLVFHPVAKAAIQQKHLERKLQEVRRMREHRSQIEDRLLERVERALESGLNERRTSHEIREEVIREIRAVDVRELPPRARVQIKRIRTRFERMEKAGR